MAINAAGEIEAAGEIKASGEIDAAGEIEATREIKAGGEIDAAGEIEASGEFDAAGDYRLSYDLRAHNRAVHSILICGDAGFATSSRDRTVRFWSQDPKRDQGYVLSKTLGGNSSSAGPLAWILPCDLFPDGRLVSGGRKKKLLLWDLRTGEVVESMEGHTKKVSGILIDDNGDIISSSIDCTIRRWRNGHTVESWKAHESPIQALIKLPSGELITGSSDCTLKIWKGRDCLRTFVGHTDSVRSLTMMPGFGILSASFDFSIRLWALTGQSFEELKGHTSPVYSVDSHSSGLIASGSEDCFLKIWRGGICVQSIEHPGWVCDAKFLYTGDILTACSDGIVRIWTSRNEQIPETREFKEYELGGTQYKINRKRIGRGTEELPGLETLEVPDNERGKEINIIKRNCFNDDVNDIYEKSYCRDLAKVQKALDGESVLDDQEEHWRAGILLLKKKRKIIDTGTWSVLIPKALVRVYHFVVDERGRHACSLGVNSHWLDVWGLFKDVVHIRCFAVSPDRAFKRFPFPRTLHLQGLPKNTCNGGQVPSHCWLIDFGPWLSALPNELVLFNLKLERIRVTNDDLAGLARKFGESIRELTLEECEGFTSVGLASIAARCKNLQVLALPCCRCSTEGENVLQWFSLFPVEQTALRVLDFSSLQDNFDINSIVNLVGRSPHLTSLHLNRHIRAKHMSTLLAMVPNITQLGVAGFSSPISMAICENLTSLNLVKTPENISSDNLISMVKQCTNLLYLYIPDRICDEGLRSIAEVLDGLIGLTVTDSETPPHLQVRVSESGLEAMEDNLKEITSISYACCWMTDSVLQSIASSCSKLNEFRLFVRNDLGRSGHRAEVLNLDHGVASFYEWRFLDDWCTPSSLSLSGFTLTTCGFHMLSESASSLVNFHVESMCDSSIDKGLELIVKNCKKLEHLEIVDCMLDDVTGLFAAIELCRDLISVRISKTKILLKHCKAGFDGKDSSKNCFVIEAVVVDNKSGISEEIFVYRSSNGRPKRNLPADVVLVLDQ